MTKDISLTDRSDKLLLALAHRLSSMSAAVSQAHIAWQKLVELETNLEKARAEKKMEDPDPAVRNSFDNLVAECQQAACELKRHYITINKGFNFYPSLENLIHIPDKRLEKDYESTLRFNIL